MWFPKILTSNLLSIPIGLLSAIVINLLTSVSINAFHWYSMLVLFLALICIALVFLMGHKIKSDYEARLKDDLLDSNRNPISRSGHWERAVRDNSKFKKWYVLIIILTFVFIVSGIFIALHGNRANLEASRKRKLTLRQSDSLFQKKLFNTLNEQRIVLDSIEKNNLEQIANITRLTDSVELLNKHTRDLKETIEIQREIIKSLKIADLD